MMPPSHIRHLLCAFIFGTMFTGTSEAAERQATPVSSIQVRAGFKVQLLRSAQEGEDSWISMCFDDQGRLLIGLDQAGIARLDCGEPGKVEFEKLDSSLKHVRGILYAHDSIYVSATNTKGLYRLRDLDGDDNFESKELLVELDYRSRFGHGSNQLLLGPDQQIYFVVGNDVSIPAVAAGKSPYRNPRDDLLLPNPRDAGQDNRVGYIARFGPDGQNWEILAGGFRNQFDAAFNKDGELFTYDADMEWDVGQPWYRPTRLNHVVSGGEYGWRWGTGKWPVYFEDSLPTTLDLGLGSPTGMTFGYGSAFPQRYRQALFLADWQNGRILMAELVPHGASYRCSYELFLEGGPLNVCDMTFGPDGALYFITGGRGSQSGLYRVTGADDTPPVVSAATADSTNAEQAQAARGLRRELESYHKGQQADSLDVIWAHLSSTDRWLRFSARVALENQDVDRWRERALNESDSWAAISALLALARIGKKSDQPAVFQALLRLEERPLSASQQLGLLRGFQLCFVRLGEPTPPQADTLNRRFSERYPSRDHRLNHLLGELLAATGFPKLVPTTLQRLSEAPSQEEQILLAGLLVRADTKWTDPQRKQLLGWINQARSLFGGKQLSERVAGLREDFLADCPPTSQMFLEEEIAAWNKTPTNASLSTTRPFVKDWKIADFEADLVELQNRKPSPGAELTLRDAGCLKCHQIGRQGTQVGPDLSSLGKRFDARAILESILEPSKVMDAKYRHMAYTLNSGRVLTGRPIGVNANTITLETDPLTQSTAEVPRAEIETSHPSPTSPMPAGLLNVLTKAEILDLVALLRLGPDLKVR